jgi:hypothetical protein
MLDPDFDPRAMADSRPMPFKKSMEGAGIEAHADPKSPDTNKGAKADATPPRTRRRNT